MARLPRRFYARDPVVLARALLGDAYAGLRAVGAISPEDAARLQALGVSASALHVTGDTRMDQVWERAAAVTPAHAVWQLLPEAAPREAGSAPEADPLLVAGSTWPADESVLLPAVAAWLTAHPGARCIIAPHEPTPEHLEAITRWAHTANVPLQRLSTVEREPTRAWRVLLVDRIGVLGDLYALAHVAFVGGGFHHAGLHSVLEPAAFGIPVLFGPRYQNAREASDLVRSGGAFVVHDAHAVREALTTLTRETVQRHEAGRRAQALVDAGRGSTQRVVTLLEHLVGESPVSGAVRPASR
jgi:3-deoxy-D-manno-octulosonic-acid transferase